mmetsp:Transcript_69038/g.179439  ORF Transcript_69038/g.179439 Transcript_69038/m.179439 type:complete len:361 (+) Transcript_69038:2-1084(+)
MFGMYPTTTNHRGSARTVGRQNAARYPHQFEAVRPISLNARRTSQTINTTASRDGSRARFGEVRHSGAQIGDQHPKVLGGIWRVQLQQQARSHIALCRAPHAEDRHHAILIAGVEDPHDERLRSLVDDAEGQPPERRLLGAPLPRPIKRSRQQRPCGDAHGRTSGDDGAADDGDGADGDESHGVHRRRAHCVGRRGQSACGRASGRDGRPGGRRGRAAGAGVGASVALAHEVLAAALHRTTALGRAHPLPRAPHHVVRMGGVLWPPDSAPAREANEECDERLADDDAIFLPAVHDLLGGDEERVPLAAAGGATRGRQRHNVGAEAEAPSEQLERLVLRPPQRSLHRVPGLCRGSVESILR